MDQRDTTETITTISHNYTIKHNETPIPPVFTCNNARLRVGDESNRLRVLAKSCLISFGGEEVVGGCG
jgi:hypothetical protein